MIPIILCLLVAATQNAEARGRVSGFLRVVQVDKEAAVGVIAH